MTRRSLRNVLPPEQRGMAMGVFGMGQTSGPMVGTVIGGSLTEDLSWRMLFFLNFAPGVVCSVLGLLVRPNVRAEVPHAFDLAGIFTMGVFLVSLRVALSRGQREGWDAPVIQRLLAYTPAQAGLVRVPGSLVLALSFPLAGRAADQCDRRVIRRCALSMFALSPYRFTSLSLEWPLSWIVWLVVRRFSCGGFVYAPGTAAALSQLAPGKVRRGAGLRNLRRTGLGHTLGLALVTPVRQRRLTYHGSVLDQQQVFSALSWGEILAPGREFVRQAGAIGQLEEAPVLALVQGHLEPQATVAAYQDCFMLVTLLCLASMPLVLLLRKPQTKRP